MRFADLWPDWRNRLISSPKFQVFAARNPLLRGEANRRAKAAFDLAAGFVYSQILKAAIETDLLELLKDGAKSLDEIAAATRLSEAAAERLLLAATALKLVEARGATRAGIRRFGLGSQGAALLGNPGALAMISHHDLFYRDLADPVALLRGTGEATALSRYWGYAGAATPDALGTDDVAPYSALMAASQPLVASDILATGVFKGRKRLLDIGGGEGAFLIAAGRAHPELDVMLFDLPMVAERARQRFAEAGLDRRATCFGGSFRSDPLPEGADAISLIRVAHDHDDAVVENLLAKIHAALPPGGILVIGEPMAETPGAESMGHAYFGFYLLAMGSGRPRSAARLAAMLKRAGFAETHRHATRRPLLASVISAVKAPYTNPQTVKTH